MNNSNHQLLHVLTREGVLINCSVRYWRGCKKLQAEDLGLKSSQVSDRLISLGHKRLLPKEALADLALVEGRAHALIDQNSFPFLNGLGHFLPNAKLGEVTDRLKELEREFRKATQSFLGRYASHRYQACLDWEEVARKLTTNSGALVKAIEASFPLAHALERQFGFNWTLFQISLPEQLSVDLISVAEQSEIVAAREKAAHEAGAKIRQDVELFVADCVASLREQTAQLCQEMLTSIGSSETGVHQKTLNRLIRFIDQFKQMNFANDRAMEEQLEEVRRTLLSRTAEEYRDNGFARGQLVQGLKALGERASELAKADAAPLVQRFGELGKRKFNLAA